MERPQPRHKGVYLLPNLFTTASLFAGFLAVLFAVPPAPAFDSCALLILFSALMDGLDGKVARLTNTASEFGVQYDSLADLVAFGMAPAFMVYQYTLSTYNKVGMAAAFLFLVCAALRLARFNISTTVTNKRFFIGLPTPAAGCTLALFILFCAYMPDFLLGILPALFFLMTVSLAILMVSNIRYHSFKEVSMFKAHPFRTLVGVVILFSLIVSNVRFWGFLIMLGYLLSGLIHTYIQRPRRTSAFMRERASSANTIHADHSSQHDTLE